MDKPNMLVNVTMDTHVRQGGEKKEIQVRGNGELVEKQLSTFVTFNEQLDDIGEVKTVIKIQPGMLTILRQGAVTMRQVYEEGREREGSYGTPYGTFQTVADTKRIAVEKSNPSTDSSMILYLQYDLELQGQKAGSYDVTIKVEEAPS